MAQRAIFEMIFQKTAVPKDNFPLEFVCVYNLICFYLISATMEPSFHLSAPNNSQPLNRA